MKINKKKTIYLLIRGDARDLKLQTQGPQRFRNVLNINTSGRKSKEANCNRFGQVSEAPQKLNIINRTPTKYTI